MLMTLQQSFFSILDKLEEYKSGVGFHFKLCYPELGVGDGCNEWIQTSNPATDSTITGFQPISISFQYDSYLNSWVGIGRDVSGADHTLIDDAPIETMWWTAIGAYEYFPTEPTIPGPRNKTEIAYLVKQVELYLYVNSKKECPDGWTYFYHTNRCYNLFHEPNITWMDSQYYCTKLGGDLAMIFDKPTNIFVYNLSGGNRTWLGAHRVGPLTDPMPRNDQWTWIDGTAMEFSYWSVDQPDNYEGDEFCLEMWPFYEPGQWNDIPCDYYHDYFICQV